MRIPAAPVILAATTLAAAGPAAAGLPAPVVRLTLAEHHQEVRINGVLAGRGGEALAGRSGRVRRALGPRDSCHEAPDATLSVWRATRVTLRTEAVSVPDCRSAGDAVVRIALAGSAGRVVTERGTIRAGRPLPASLRATAERTTVSGSRTVRAWPRTDPCTGLIDPGSTALLVRTLHGAVVSAAVYTGITDVITCLPDSGLVSPARAGATPGGSRP